MANNKKLTLNVDYRWLSLALFAVIVILLVWLRPWHKPGDTNREISVTGEAKISAVPDEYVFYPSYEIKNNDQDAAVKQLTTKSNQVVSKLKALGVPDEMIKTNANNYERFAYPGTNAGIRTYDLQLTVTVSGKTLAQKVQDYLLTTELSGSISPYPTFSDEQRKQLEDQARDIASKDARAKATQLASNIGAELGDVKSLEEQSGFGDVIPLDATVESKANDTSLTLQPGENKLTYTIVVVYYLK